MRRQIFVIKDIRVCLGRVGLLVQVGEVIKQLYRVENFYIYFMLDLKDILRFIVRFNVKV